jgi:hypothetical protein
MPRKVASRLARPMMTVWSAPETLLKPAALKM